jgi:hypothetical protein
MVEKPITIKNTTFFLPKSSTAISMVEEAIFASLQRILNVICHDWYNNDMYIWWKHSTHSKLKETMYLTVPK